ncbi:MAG: HIT domain-containing protein [Planctomycetes bacterium]|nr:HIT domain-containing protein [Planctomycetota bacterium]
MDPRCVLCRGPGGEVLWHGATCRVVLVAEPGYAGYCRVVWNRHVRELTDLSVGERRTLWRAVDAVEAALRETLEPAKVNVASLGNVVPHLHVHVVARFRDDPHFPAAVWGPPVRSGSGHLVAGRQHREPGPPRPRAAIETALRRRLGPVPAAP